MEYLLSDFPPPLDSCRGVLCGDQGGAHLTRDLAGHAACINLLEVTQEAVGTLCIVCSVLCVCMLVRWIQGPCLCILCAARRGLCICGVMCCVDAEWLPRLPLG